MENVDCVAFVLLLSSFKMKLEVIGFVKAHFWKVILKNYIFINEHMKVFFSFMCSIFITYKVKYFKTVSILMIMVYTVTVKYSNILTSILMVKLSAKIIEISLHVRQIYLMLPFWNYSEMKHWHSNIFETLMVFLIYFLCFNVPKKGCEDSWCVWKGWQPSGCLTSRQVPFLVAPSGVHLGSATPILSLTLLFILFKFHLVVIYFIKYFTFTLVPYRFSVNKQAESFA